MFSFLKSSPLSPGTPAPDFTLRDQDGASVTLSRLRGRNVILVFYPRDETPTCTRQLCEFRDAQPLVAAANTLVFGVNPGNDASHAKFRERRHLPFPLLVDDGSRVASLYNAKGPFFTVRTVYLIGPDGVIRYASRGKPDPREVVASAG